MGPSSDIFSGNALAAWSAPGAGLIALAAGLCAAVCVGALIRDRLRARGLWGRRGQVIVDGSNVLYWKIGQPGIEAIRDVLERLDQAGLKAGVMFDANAGNC